VKPARFGIGLRGDRRPSEYGRLGRLAEELGFDVVSVFADLGYQPPFQPLLEVAAATHRVSLGPACLNPYTTHPVEIAGQVAALDLVSNGRAYLGLSKGAWLGSIGVPQGRPVRAIREAAEIVRLLLAGDESRWLGQHYIGTEHILLGLARSNEEPLLALLHVLEISPEQIRRRVRRLLQDGITEISIEQAKRVARLSELSRRVLNGAEQIAEKMGHKNVGLAHLLLALARERRSVCARVLREAGLDDAALEANLIKPRPATGGMLEDVIDRAVDRAESFGSHYTGTDHLLLSLASDPRGARLLHKYGADTQLIVQQMRDYLSR